MRHLLRLTDWTADDVAAVFELADAYAAGRGPQLSGLAVMFFPAASLRTRVSFERGAALSGLQPVVFPPETLDKSEALVDVASYLASWADVLVVRHPSLIVLEGLAESGTVPVVNAMTNENHPCEVLADLWSLGRESDPRALRYLFVGPDGNIARAWREAATVLGLSLRQCCPPALVTPGVDSTDDLQAAVRTADVILTDAPGAYRDELAPFQITAAVLDTAPAGVRLAPCPPFERGREVSADAIAHPAFVGHGFKAALLPVQRAVLTYCMG